MARGLKFRILEEEGLYYPCSENKGVISFAFTAKLICVFVFAYAKSRFSHDAAHLIMILICSGRESGESIDIYARDAFVSQQGWTLLAAGIICFSSIYEPRCFGFLPGPTQTRLCNYRRWLEALNFVYRK